jgi:hypothetical protein
MEPQDNVKLAITKALSAHEEAQSSLADLVNSADRRFAAMSERLRQNIAELHLLNAEEPPAEA